MSEKIEKSAQGPHDVQRFADEVAVLRERLRAGQLTRERVDLAAYCGHLGARAVARTLEPRRTRLAHWARGLARVSWSWTSLSATLAFDNAIKASSRRHSLHEQLVTAALGALPHTVRSHGDLEALWQEFMEAGGYALGLPADQEVVDLDADPRLFELSCLNGLAFSLGLAHGFVHPPPSPPMPSLRAPPTVAQASGLRLAFAERLRLRRLGGRWAITANALRGALETAITRQCLA